MGISIPRQSKGVTIISDNLPTGKFRMGDTLLLKSEKKIMIWIKGRWQLMAKIVSVN